MSVQPDPRVVRTTLALHRAVVELASERPISQVTVADLATRAGVTRATFYNRFARPRELLIEVLCADLDRGHRLEAEHHVEGQYTGPELTRMATDEVAEHVLRFEQVYRRIFEDRADHVVHEALVRHFADYALAHIRDRDPRDLPAADYQLMAQFLAHGFAGALTAWLRDDRITKQELVDAAVACAPAWWS
ncbi:TetR/AcrR family transcriptional regulator [Nocardia sp. NPDC004340]